MTQNKLAIEALENLSNALKKHYNIAENCSWGHYPFGEMEETILTALKSPQGNDTNALSAFNDLIASVDRGLENGLMLEHSGSIIQDAARCTLEYGDKIIQGLFCVQGEAVVPDEQKQIDFGLITKQPIHRIIAIAENLCGEGVPSPYKTKAYVREILTTARAMLSAIPERQYEPIEEK